MNEHLHKDIIERSRYASWAPNRKTRLKINNYDPDDDYDRVVRTRVVKEVSDNLGPLQKFLCSNVGRLWDKVYSEVCRTIDRRTTAGWHFMTHLSGMVERNVYIDAKGDVYRMRAPYYYRSHYKGYYVHPKTGLLLYSAGAPVQERKAEPVQSVKVSESRYYKSIDGIWYVCDYVRRDPDEKVWRSHGFVLVKHLPDEQQLRMISKRQIGKRDLRRLRKEEVLPS
jgi:hypothetical protein